MTSSLQLGPLALPLPPLVLAVAAMLSLAVGKRLGRSVGVDAEPALWRMFLLGLVASRLGLHWWPEPPRWADSIAFECNQRCLTIFVPKTAPRRFGRGAVV